MIGAILPLSACVLLVYSLRYDGILSLLVDIKLALFRDLLESCVRRLLAYSSTHGGVAQAYMRTVRLWISRTWSWQVLLTFLHKLMNLWSSLVWGWRVSATVKWLTKSWDFDIRPGWNSIIQCHRSTWNLTMLVFVLDPHPCRSLSSLCARWMSGSR